jgi:hypothetical protein
MSASRPIDDQPTAVDFACLAAHDDAPQCRERVRGLEPLKRRT